jgi:hypothetical protein
MNGLRRRMPDRVELRQDRLRSARLDAPTLRARLPGNRRTTLPWSPGMAQRTGRYLRGNRPVPDARHHSGDTAGRALLKDALRITRRLDLLDGDLIEQNPGVAILRSTVRINTWTGARCLSSASGFFFRTDARDLTRCTAFSIPLRQRAGAVAPGNGHVRCGGCRASIASAYGVRFQHAHSPRQQWLAGAAAAQTRPTGRRLATIMAAAWPSIRRAWTCARATWWPMNPSGSIAPGLPACCERWRRDTVLITAAPGCAPGNQ